MYVIETNINGNIENENNQTCQHYTDALLIASGIAAAHGSNAVVTVTNTTNGSLCWKSDDTSALKRYTNISHENYMTFNLSDTRKSDKPSVYFDMDGTLAYWYSDARGLRYPDEVLDPKNHYYRNLEPHPFMVELARNLVNNGYDVCIMSAADKDIIRDKYDWIDEHLPFINKDNIFFCPIGADKNEFVKGNADKSILIDDYHVNLNQWRGMPIKAINTVNSFDENLQCIDGKSAEEDRDCWNVKMRDALGAVSAAVMKLENKDKSAYDYQSEQLFCNVYSGEAYNDVVISTIKIGDNQYETTALDPYSGELLFQEPSKTLLGAAAVHRAVVERFNYIINSFDDKEAFEKNGFVDGRKNYFTERAALDFTDTVKTNALVEYSDYYNYRPVLTISDFDSTMHGCLNKAREQYVLNAANVPRLEQIPITLCLNGRVVYEPAFPEAIELSNKIREIHDYENNNKCFQRLTTTTTVNGVAVKAEYASRTDIEQRYDAIQQLTGKSQAKVNNGEYRSFYFNEDISDIRYQMTDNSITLKEEVEGINWNDNLPYSFTMLDVLNRSNIEEAAGISPATAFTRFMNNAAGIKAYVAVTQEFATQLMTSRTDMQLEYTQDNETIIVNVPLSAAEREQLLKDYGEHLWETLGMPVKELLDNRCAELITMNEPLTEFKFENVPYSAQNVNGKPVISFPIESINGKDVGMDSFANYGLLKRSDFEGNTGITAEEATISTVNPWRIISSNGSSVTYHNDFEAYVSFIAEVSQDTSDAPARVAVKAEFNNHDIMTKVIRSDVPLTPDETAALLATIEEELGTKYKTTVEKELKSVTRQNDKNRTIEQ